MRKSIVALVLPALCPILTAQTAAPAPQQQAESYSSASAPRPTEKPRVFITDSQSWEISGEGGGSSAAFGTVTNGGARPQTAEIVKTFGERCTTVVVNNKQEFADYVVVLDHEGGKGVLRHRNKVAVFEHRSGDVVISRSTLSLGGSVEEACNGIRDNWEKHSAEIIAARRNPESLVRPANAEIAPKTSAPESSVSIESNPPGADIEVDSEFIGNTPSTVHLTPGAHEITVKKKGFTAWSRKIKVTGGSVHVSADLEVQPGQ